MSEPKQLLPAQDECLREMARYSDDLSPDWSDAAGAAVDLIAQLQADLAAAVAKGAAFKDFVHAYLDAHGVPAGDPDNPHQKEGCRIGARLDLIFAERDRLRATVRREVGA